MRTLLCTMFVCALRGRQSKSERRAFPQLALCPDRASVCLNDVLADVKPQANPAAHIAVDVPEPFEYMWQRGLRNADTAVPHGEDNQFCLLLDMQRHCSAILRELHRVSQQVREYLHDAVVVEERRHAGGRRIDGECDASG